MMKDDVLYWLWLATRPNCGVKFCHDVINYCGTPEKIWQAQWEDISKIPAVPRAKANALMDKDVSYPERILLDCEKQGIDIVTFLDENYPASLREIADPPLLLYVRGTLPDFENSMSISIVGTRRATQYGLDAARYFAGNLAQSGCIIVSGMALGIDGMANGSAIEAGGQTVAVLGCGVDVCYPWQHRDLMVSIIKHGAVISEYPPGVEPKGVHFPVRNRIITGLSQGTLIVEAPKKSGALISADLALEQGRDVFAVPGNINRLNSQGCNQIIRQGAAELVQTPADILSHYRQNRQAQQPVPVFQGTEQAEHQEEEESISVCPMRKLEGTQEERMVWQAIRDGSYSQDAIVEATQLLVSVVSTALTMLEVNAYVIRTAQGYRAADNVEL